MILTAVHQMMSTGESLNSSNFCMPAPLVKKQKTKTIKQDKKHLQKERLLPSCKTLVS